VAAELGTPPIVLSLDELMGHQGTAETYLETVKGALKKMDMEDGKNVIALTTDDPNVMQAFWRLFGDCFFWVLVSYFVVLQKCNGSG